MTEHDDELGSRLTDYLQGYATYSRPAPVKRRARHWPEALAAGLAAVIAAGAITAGYFALRPGGGGEAAGPIGRYSLLFKTLAFSASDCASGVYSTPAPSAASTGSSFTAGAICGFATVSPDGGILLPVATANAPDLFPRGKASTGLLGLLEGAKVVVYPTGSIDNSATGSGAASSSSREPNEDVTGFYVLDLSTDTWSHVRLAAPITAVQALASGGSGEPTFTQPLTGVLSPDGSEVAVPTDAGTPGIDVVDLSTGAIRPITPAMRGGFALQGWLTDGIHVSVPCGDSTGGGLCGYVIDPRSGTATARPAEDGDIQLIGSPDGTQELVVPPTAANGIWTKVVAGPAGGGLHTIYTAPAGKDVSACDIGDDGSILTAVGTGSGWKELILADGSVTTATPPPGGWAPAGTPPDAGFEIPGGGFVAVVWTGPGPSVQELVRVMPDGSTSIIESISEDTAELIGLAG
jgi:hypothetical protein